MHTLHFDGACRGNPGPSSFGCSISLDGEEIDSKCFFIGKATNNVAEYSGALYGLRRCLSLDIFDVIVYGDSLLVIKQVTKQWKINNANLKKFHTEITGLIPKFNSIEFKHIKRHLNTRADELANIALNNRSGHSLLPDQSS